MTTWNPADSVNMTFSGGNLIATSNNQGSTQGVRTTTSKNSGKSVIEITCDFSVSNLFSLSISVAGGAYDESDGIQTSLFWNFPDWYFRGGSFFSIDSSGASPPTGTDVLRLHLDYTGNVLYWTHNGANLFGGDPAAGTGGLGPLPANLFASCWTLFAPRSFTLNPTPTSLPSGWSAWDAAAAGIPNQLIEVKQSIKRASYW